MMEVVLRLPRGEDLREVSWEVQVFAPDVGPGDGSSGKAGASKASKRRRGGPLERELERTRAKVEELRMKLEHAQDSWSTEGASPCGSRPASAEG
jgi:hypothetical protein